MTVEEIVFSQVGPFARGLGFLSLLPLGMSLQGLGVRVTLAILISFLAPEESLTPCSAMRAAIEFLVGLLCGLPAAITVSAAGMWGELTEVARGTSLAQFYDPLQEMQDSATASLARNLVWAALLCLGLGEELCAAFSKSFSVVSVTALFGGGINFFLFEVGQLLIIYLTTLLGSLCLAALPLVGAFLLAELSAAFIVKLVPGLCLTSELFWVKTTLALLFCSHYLTPGTFSSLFELARHELIT